MLPLTNSFLVTWGFIRSQFDPCVYVCTDGMFILLYVDDLLIIGHQRVVAEVRQQLAERFEVVRLGAVKHF